MCTCVCVYVCVCVKCSFKMLVGGLRVKPEKDIGRKGVVPSGRKGEERERNGGKEIERLPSTFHCKLTGLDA